ncbi:uncharacterized protein LOC135847358 [Planococcus citri]|uniref:uncharacterized protein LOC135847358 n=1 Tax=Planococcus citri TaxID=170843 RepID=UPI0031F8BA2A
MAILLSYCKLFVISCCVLPFSLTMSVHKTAGSEHFGIMPPRYAKVAHQTLPTPEGEGYQFINDASYYYNRANNEVVNFLKQWFGTSDEKDPQIDEGVYECKKGDCKMIDLNEQQLATFHEKLKGKKIRTGNVLTAKVEKMDAGSSQGA